jgi:hypothetical protein
MNRAGATLGFAAAVLGSRQPNKVPNGPEQRHLRIDFKFMQLPVYLQ